jgi:murein DD-endopeptidase MepM/ murein hydrolase activator NlpD
MAAAGWLLALLMLAAAPGCQLADRGRLAPAPEENHPAGEEHPPDQLPPAASGPLAPPENSGDPPPLQFTLPTPGPAPISLWRPPLYDTPWALGPNDHFYFNRPIAADEVNWPVADYRYGGIFFGSDIVHTGVDIPTPTGTPVLAAASGRVIWAGYGLFYGNNDPSDPYGLAVTIRHDFGFQGQRLYTVYAHMDQIDVIYGQQVDAGDVLGLVGTTGLTTGPHLHFEVRMESNSYFATLNPELWLAPPQGWGVLAGKLLNTNGSYLTEQDVTVRNLETRQAWVVRTYGNQAINGDPYYEENLVLSDLPAGQYEIVIDYQEERYQADVSIFPGAVSYFTFRGKLYFDTSLPPTPSIDELLREQ